MKNLQESPAQYSPAVEEIKLSGDQENTALGSDGTVWCSLPGPVMRTRTTSFPVGETAMTSGRKPCVRSTHQLSSDTTSSCGESSPRPCHRSQTTCELSPPNSRRMGWRAALSSSP